MKLSLRGDYALRSLIVLARYYREQEAAQASAPGRVPEPVSRKTKAGSPAKGGLPKRAAAHAAPGALSGTELIVRIQAISEEQKIPKRFLEQILNDMKAGGFVESRRGIAGGYRLARPPEEIRLTALIRWLEGGLLDGDTAQELPRRGNRPESLEELTVRTTEAELAVRSVLAEVREAMLKVLDRLTLADLLERSCRFHPAAVSNGMEFMI